MIKTPYSAFVTQHYRMDKIYRAIEPIFIKGELSLFTEVPEGQDAIYLVTSRNEDVPVFAHPIHVPISVRNDEVITVIDARPFTRVDKDDPSQYIITQNMDLHMSVLRVLLGRSYDEFDKFKELYIAGDVSMWAYTRWLTSQLSARLALDPDNEIKLSMIIALHYANMHGVVIGESESDLARVATRISRIISVSTERVIAVVQSLPEMGDLPSLSEVIRTTLDTTRVEKVSSSMILNVAIGSAGWRGVQAKEIVGIALEHAPTWHAMMLNAIDHATYKRSAIAELVLKKYRDQDALRSYTRVLGAIVKNVG